MAYKNLNQLEMLQTTGTWIDITTKANTAILAIPELASFVPRITGAHTGLAAATQPIPIPRLAVIIEQQSKLDIRHDTIIRAVVGFLTSLADFIGGDEGTAFITLRDLLLPDGLRSQLKSYAAEAGQARQLADRMTSEVRKQTDAIFIGQVPNAATLTSYVDELIGLGKQLGDLEDEKGRIESAGTGGAARQDATNHWIRVVNAFVSNAALADLDPTADTLIFGPLRAVEKKADEREREVLAKEKAAKAKAAKDAAAGTTAPAGTGPAGTAPAGTPPPGTPPPGTGGSGKP